MLESFYIVASSKSSAGSSSNCSNGGYSSGAALCSLVCKFVMTETFTSGESSLSSVLSNFQFNSLLSSFDISTITLLICLVIWKKRKKQQSTKWDRLSVGHGWVLWRLGWLFHFISLFVWEKKVTYFSWYLVLNLIITITQELILIVLFSIKLYNADQVKRTSSTIERNPLLIYK